MPALYEDVHVSGGGGGWVEKASDANLKTSLLGDKTSGLQFIFLFLSSSLSSLLLLSFPAIECIPTKPLYGIGFHCYASTN